MDELLSDFLSEVTDHIQEIESHVVVFEKNPDNSEAIRQIFRLFHTIKGTAGFLGLARLQSVSHSAETLIDGLRSGRAPVSPAASLLLKAIDRVKSLLESVAELGEEPAGDDTDIVSRIETFLDRGDDLEAGSALADTPVTPKQEETCAQQAATDRQEIVPETPGTVAGNSPQADVAPSVAEAIAQSQPSPSQKADADQTPSKAASGKEMGQETLRIPTAVIERIMALATELVLSRNQIMNLSRRQDMHQMKMPLERLSGLTSELQDAVMQARMQPLRRLFDSVPRLIRDLSAETGKEFNVVIEGADTRLDRQLIESIRDPLMHLVRNCADHGIESPQERAERGKPAAGLISIVASQDSGQIVIEVSDDGRGFDSERIRAKAVERGLAEADAVARMTDEEVYRFILEPGFSTAQTITTISGRGVGMDVVRAHLEAIGGSIGLHSTKGAGSRFLLRIPLTLAIEPALIVQAAGQRFALPQKYVVEALDYYDGSHVIGEMEGQRVLRLRDEVFPVAALATMFDLDDSDASPDKVVIVLRLGARKLGLIVDGIGDIQEIVVKPLSRLFQKFRIFTGCTILGEGSVILILDPAGMADFMKLDQEPVKSGPPVERAVERTETPLILFKAGNGATKAVFRKVVSRIIRVDATDITRADGRLVHRYQGRLIPVQPLTDSPTGKSVLILILNVGDETFGLAIDAVIDIVSSQAVIELEAATPGLLGTVSIARDAVELIDPEHFRQLAFSREIVLAVNEPGAELALHDDDASVTDCAGGDYAMPAPSSNHVAAAGAIEKDMCHAG
jgi:two-component system chemotaxis sensor kinase CheA